jgi:SAM-dependent methyltransferase
MTVGAGDGYLEQRLQDLGHRVVCIDLDPDSVASLASRGIEAMQADLATFAWAGAPVDLVVASEVLEHLDPEVASTCVTNMVAPLRSGGRLLVTVPCRENLARSQICCPHCGEVFHRYGHLQSFDADSIQKLVSQAGVEIERCEERLFPNYADLNLGGKLTSFAKHLAWRVGGRHTPGLRYFVSAVK